MSVNDGVKICEITQHKSDFAREILTALPAWFGIPESPETYVREAGALPMLGATAGSDPIGFLSLKEHNSFTTEAFVLGVKPDWHRKGVGRRLFQNAETSLRAGGQFLHGEDRGRA
jgi:ribosomal protein S18 acetylase RimI-like enzyme